MISEHSNEMLNTELLLNQNLKLISEQMLNFFHYQLSVRKQIWKIEFVCVVL
jgi:hypothetical protein